VAEALGNYSKGNVLMSHSSKLLATKRYELIKGYLQSVETQFALTGRFWEKYNLHTSTLNVTNEYAMPDFFGWTAGVYMEYRIEFAGP
jgi:neutral trehalase